MHYLIDPIIAAEGPSPFLGKQNYDKKMLF